MVPPNGSLISPRFFSEPGRLVLGLALLGAIATQIVVFAVERDDPLGPMADGEGQTGRKGFWTWQERPQSGNFRIAEPLKAALSRLDSCADSQPIDFNEDDGARTRNLRRDRPVL